MIERHDGTFEVNCDYCPEAVDTGEEDFYHALDEIKSQGWVVFRRRGEWRHRCPVCLGEATDIEVQDERGS